MPSDLDPVAQAYNENPTREWERLERDAYHSLEFLVTLHHLEKYLPPGGPILDAGGGPGRYALELCRRGNEVVLLDISPALISLAKGKFALENRMVQSKLLGFATGDIRDLARFETNYFTAVLCLGGALSQIGNEQGRLLAMSELVRVAKPGAPILVSVIGYFAALRTILARFNSELVRPSFQSFVQRGDLVGNTRTIWHFYRAEEIRQLAESCGVTTLEMAGCEGLSTGLAEATNALGQDPAKWKAWLELVVATSSQPGPLQMSEHFLYIGRKS